MEEDIGVVVLRRSPICVGQNVPPGVLTRRPARDVNVWSVVRVRARQSSRHPILLGGYHSRPTDPYDELAQRFHFGVLVLAVAHAFGL